jgi:hypothetical protein
MTDAATLDRITDAIDELFWLADELATTRRLADAEVNSAVAMTLIKRVVREIAPDAEDAALERLIAMIRAAWSRVAAARRVGHA